MLPEDFWGMVDQWQHRQLPMEAILTRCGMCRSTFYRITQEYRH